MGMGAEGTLDVDTLHTINLQCLRSIAQEFTGFRPQWSQVGNVQRAAYLARKVDKRDGVGVTVMVEMRQTDGLRYFCVENPGWCSCLAFPGLI
jgi:hypothetical protein